MSKKQDFKKENGCEGELMLYLHIPFCIRKCKYCDFLSGAYSPKVQKDYVQALKQEIRVRCQTLRGKKVGSLFLGGGTPSVLSADLIGELIEECRKALEFLPEAEITMECNPGTADLRKLRGYREAGVNRLSIGLQSPDEKMLQLLGRIHTWQQFLDTYKWAREAGFQNISVDLMSGLPGQTKANWEQTLLKILSLDPQPEHLSAYSLIVEEGTTFYDWETQGKFTGTLALPSEDEDREMYHLTGKILEDAGYQQYEISNYAAPGFACRHNCGYWLRREYLGLGLGAASLIGDVRYSNERDLDKYLADPLAGREEEVLTREDRMAEFMFLGLRMTEGVSCRRFEEAFGKEMYEVYGEIIQKNVRDDLLTETEEGIALTQKGLDISNYVMAQFLI